MKKVVATTNAPGAIGPYSQAIIAGDNMYISGQLPINPATGEMPADIKAQTKQSLENIKAILESEGLSMKNVVKTTVLMQNMGDFNDMNAVYSEFFTEECRLAPLLRLQNCRRTLWLRSRQSLTSNKLDRQDEKPLTFCASGFFVWM